MTTDAIARQTVTQTAHAKINLALHVTGQRGDGYHVLDSLVMFTSLGDEITVQTADELTLTIDGPFGGDLDASADNLVLRAARAMSEQTGARITLTKNLPVASGIGGGSADAAATCRALAQIWDVPLPKPEVLLALGADVPVCMTPKLSRMSGIGDEIQTFGPAPMLDVLLVNPRIKVSTLAVFQGLVKKSNTRMSDPMPDPFDTDDWLDWLATQRNDLEEPAREIAPVIGTVLGALRQQPQCRLARMSGSGATCFAIFEDHLARDAAADMLGQAHPEWWIAPTDEAPV